MMKWNEDVCPPRGWTVDEGVFFNFPLPEQRAFIMYSKAYFLIFYTSPSERWWVGLWICFPICCCSRKMGEANAFPDQPTNRQLIEFEVLWYVDSSASSNQICSVPRHLHPQNDDGLELNFPAEERGEALIVHVLNIWSNVWWVAWACLFCATWGNLCKINIRLGLDVFEWGEFIPEELIGNFHLVLCFWDKLMA